MYCKCCMRETYQIKSVIKAYRHYNKHSLTKYNNIDVFVRDKGNTFSMNDESFICDSCFKSLNPENLDRLIENERLL